MTISNDQVNRSDNDKRMDHWGPNASQSLFATTGRFRPLTSEEEETHRRWRRVTLTFYCTLAASILLVSIAASPPGPTTAKNNPAYSAIVSRVEINPVDFGVKR